MPPGPAGQQPRQSRQPGLARSRLARSGPARSGVDPKSWAIVIAHRGTTLGRPSPHHGSRRPNSNGCDLHACSYNRRGDLDHSGAKPTGDPAEPLKRNPDCKTEGRPRHAPARSTQGQAVHGTFSKSKEIAVVGTGISGMSAAWLLSQRHDVTVYECDHRIGGHSNTVTVAGREWTDRRRHRLHRLQRTDLPQPDGAVRPSRSADAIVGHVVFGVAGERRAGIFRQQPVGPVCREAQSVFARVSGRCCTICNASIARRRAISRCSNNSTPHSAIIWTPKAYGASVPARSSAADGGRDLVGAGKRNPRLSRRVIHPLPGQPRPAEAAQSSAMADRAGGSRTYVERLTRCLRGPHSAIGGVCGGAS